MSEEAVVEAPKREKKLRKSFTEGEKVSIEVFTGLTFEELTTGTIMEFDLINLPENVLAKLATYGLGHRLGDSAAGKHGQDAVDAINRVWDGMIAGNWTVRQPKKDEFQEARTRLQDMSEDDADKAKQLLAELGIKI